jgi:hypothetical protein
MAASKEAPGVAKHVTQGALKVGQPHLGLDQM